MKYSIGLIILIAGIYAITDLAIKTRYTRKRLKPSKIRRALIKLIDDLTLSILLSIISKLHSIRF